MKASPNGIGPPQGKTADEIRATFHLPDDLTEEEKLEPLNNVTDDPRIRLLNRLYARKRRELAERKSNAALPPNQVDLPQILSCHVTAGLTSGCCHRTTAQRLWDRLRTAALSRNY